MKKYSLLVILCSLFILPAFAAQNEKIVDKSGKEPKWIYASGADFITVAAEAKDLQDAKDKAMIQVKKQILNSIAENVKSTAAVTTQERGVNGKYNVIEEYASLVETEGALIPFLGEVSISKADDYYWEKLKRGKEYSFRYHIKYPFTQFDLMRMSDEYLTREREINNKLNDFAKDNFTTYTSVEQMIQRLTDLRLFKASLMERDPRRVTCANIEKVYNNYLKSIAIRLVSVSKKQLVYTLYFGENNISNNLQPKFETECLLDLQYKPQNGNTLVTYDFETACYETEQNRLTITLSIGGNKVKNTFIVK